MFSPDWAHSTVTLCVRVCASVLYGLLCVGGGGGGGGVACVWGLLLCVCVCATVFVADMSVCTSDRMGMRLTMYVCECVLLVCTCLTMHVCECVLLVYTSHHACVCVLLVYTSHHVCV